MIHQRFARQSEDIVLQVLQVLDASHFLHRVRIAEDEVAKAEIAANQVTQVNIQLLRVLVDKTGMTLTGKFLVL